MHDNASIWNTGLHRKPTPNVQDVLLPRLVFRRLPSGGRKLVGGILVESVEAPSVGGGVLGGFEDATIVASVQMPSLLADEFYILLLWF